MLKGILLSILSFALLSQAQTDSLNYYYLNSDFDKALLVGETLIMENTATELDFIKVAQIYYSNYDYRKALKVLTQSDSLFPENKKLKYIKAQVLYKYNRLNKASLTINSLLKIDSLNKKYLFLAMKISKVQKKHTLTSSYINNLLLSDSTNAVYHYMLGKNSITLKKNNYAIKNFETTIRYDSTYSDAYKWLGKIYDALKKWDTSLYYINKAIYFEPSNINYYKQRANTHYNRVHYFRAIPDFEKVWKTDTTSAKISYKLGVCYQQIKKYKESHKLFLKSYSIDSTNYRINQYLGMSYYHKKEYEKAVSYIEKAQELIQPDKNIVKVLQSHLAVNYFENKQYNKSVQYNKIMSKYYPKNEWYYYYIAESYFALNNFREAEKYYKKIRRQLPLEYQNQINQHLIVIKEHLFFEDGK